MFSKEVTTSDLFVDMPSSSQLLYFHLGMEADDEGFIGNAKMLSRAYGANTDDLKLLEAKGFIIVFPSGVTVVKDWNLNNQIRKDRLKSTIYTEEKNLLTVDVNGSYLIGNQLPTKLQPTANQMSAQDSIGKDSIDKIRVDIDNSVEFDEYFKIFTDFAKKNVNNRSRAMQEFIKLPPFQKEQAIIGARNYVKSYELSGNSVQYSKNAATFLEEMIFTNYQQVIIPEQKSSGAKVVKSAPKWSNPDYVETTSLEEQAEFEKYKKERKKEYSRDEIYNQH